MSLPHHRDLRLAPLCPPSHIQSTLPHPEANPRIAPAQHPAPSYHFSGMNPDSATRVVLSSQTQLAPLPSIAPLTSSSALRHMPSATVVDAKGPTGLAGTYSEDFGSNLRNQSQSYAQFQDSVVSIPHAQSPGYQKPAFQSYSMGTHPSWTRTVSVEGASFDQSATPENRRRDSLPLPSSPPETPIKSSIVPPPGQKISSMSIETLLTSDDDHSNQVIVQDPSSSIPPPPAYSELDRSYYAPQIRGTESWAPASCSPTSSMDIQHAGNMGSTSVRTYCSLPNQRSYLHRQDSSHGQYTSSLSNEPYPHPSNFASPYNAVTCSNANSSSVNYYSNNLNCRSDPYNQNYIEHSGAGSSALPSSQNHPIRFEQPVAFSAAGVVPFGAENVTSTPMYAEEPMQQRPFTRVVSETEASSAPGTCNASSVNVASATGGMSNSRPNASASTAQISDGLRRSEELRREHEDRVVALDSASSPVHRTAVPESSIMTSPSSTVSAPVLGSMKSGRKRTRGRGETRELFKCPYANCNKVSAEASNIKAHCRTHTGEKPYVCQKDACGKRFRWKSSLSYHQKAVHSNLRPYACQSCDKRFLESRKLQLHLDWCPAMRQQQERMAIESGTGASASGSGHDNVSGAVASPVDVSSPSSMIRDTDNVFSETTTRMAAATALASFSVPSSFGTSGFFSKRR